VTLAIRTADDGTLDVLVPEARTAEGAVTAEPRRRAPDRSTAKSGHAPILKRHLSTILPSPENDQLYRPVDPDDPEIRALADSIRKHGLREPLVISLDGYVISGHRRRVACRLAGLSSVDVRVELVRRTDDITAFVVLLREYNRQRDKSLDEKIREEIVTASPHEAYASLVAHRRRKAAVTLDTIEMRTARGRAEITKAKRPLLEAIRRVLVDQREFLPLSDRRIHYALLNDPPLRHASKPGSGYANDLQSYKSLTDLLTRARVAGLLPMDAIADDTRPQTMWDVHGDPRSFVRRELDELLKGYSRDLLRSQPNHIEIVVEKNTVEPIVRPVAMEYCIPIVSGRGFCSLPPRAAMAERFERGGKSRLVILFVTDFDPDGEEIAHSFARSMRDDFGIQNITPVKVALTHEQVKAFSLQPNMQAKEGSSRYERFVERYGPDVYELEAIPPAALQKVVREAVDDVLDVELFNAEIDAEKLDAAFLAEMRQRVHVAMRGIGGGA
jgi:hypothetical protein